VIPKAFVVNKAVKNNTRNGIAISFFIEPLSLNQVYAIQYHNISQKLATEYGNGLTLEIQ